MLCPSFESEETRILTFSDNWPHRVDNLSPERMAKAGFLYRGSDDRAFCFYCGVSIISGRTRTSQKLNMRNTGPRVRI